MPYGGIEIATAETRLAESYARGEGFACCCFRETDWQDRDDEGAISALIAWNALIL